MATSDPATQARDFQVVPYRSALILRRLQAGANEFLNQEPVISGFVPRPVWIDRNDAALRVARLNFSNQSFSTPPPMPPFPPAPPFPSWPVAGITSMTAFIPAYVYQQYSDDDDIQAFVAAYNQIGQNYVNTFNDVNLPIYTGLSGYLLDWVAMGLYGIPRPNLSTGFTRGIGPYNTYPYNTHPYAYGNIKSTSQTIIVTDDIYKRIITWNFYKGDGNVFSIRWLKRRIKRFLTGTNGTAPNIDTTYDISVTVSGTVVSINILVSYPLSAVLQQGIRTGVLALPFFYSYGVSYV